MGGSDPVSTLHMQALRTLEDCGVCMAFARLRPTPFCRASPTDRGLNPPVLFFSGAFLASVPEALNSCVPLVPSPDQGLLLPKLSGSASSFLPNGRHWSARPRQGAL